MESDLCEPVSATCRNIHACSTERLRTSITCHESPIEALTLELLVGAKQDPDSTGSRRLVTVSTIVHYHLMRVRVRLSTWMPRECLGSMGIFINFNRASQFWI